MYWVVMFRAGVVGAREIWAVVGFWRDQYGFCIPWTYRTRGDAMVAMDLLRAGRPGRYKLGRSPLAPPPLSFVRKQT